MRCPTLQATVFQRCLYRYWYGMVMNDNQEIDPQSALKISFNGAAVSGCGFEGSDKDLSTLNLKSLNPGADDDNTIRITAGGKTVTVNFKGRNTADIQKAIDDAFNNAGVARTQDK